MKMNEQCVPYVHNSSYCVIPIVLKMYICPDHALKLCMWFEYNTYIYFWHFFLQFELHRFSDIYTKKLHMVWIYIILRLYLCN